MKKIFTSRYRSDLIADITKCLEEELDEYTNIEGIVLEIISNPTSI